MTSRLLKNGIISFEQAELAEGPDGTPSPVRLGEVLGYFGAVATFIATIALMVEVAIADEFPLGDIDNIPGGVVVLAGSILLLAVGYWLTGEDAGPIKRSGGFVLASGFGLWAIAISLLLLELDAADFTPILIAVPIAAAAWWVYQRHPSVPTNLSLFFAAVQVLNAALVLIQVTEYVSPQDTVLRVALSGSIPEVEWLAMVFHVGLGVAWVWLAKEGWLKTRNTGFAIGSTYAGAQGVALFGTDDGWIILFAGVAALVVYGGLAWRSSVLLGVGTVGLAIFVWMAITILVDEITAINVALWFGVPGILALGYLLYSVRSAAEASD